MKKAKATSKSERKYGKKEEDVITAKPKKKVVEMYKVLVDRANFTVAMTYDECLEYIEQKNAQAAKERRSPPSMTLVLA